MGLCWWVLVCGAVLGVAGTPTAPAAPTFSGHVAVAPVTSWGVGIQAMSPAHSAATVPGGIHAQPRSEEPSMNFTLRLLHGDPGATKTPLVLSSGSVLHLEARVDFGPGVSPRIYVDQCYGTGSGWPGHSRRAYVVVNSQGCLHGPNLGSVSVQHLRGASVLQLSILPPVLEAEPEEEVYVHCLLTAWGTQKHSLRSCFYSETAARWHNAEDPSQSAPCDCCDSGCPRGDTPPGQQPEFPGEGMLHRETIGPFLVQDLVPWYEAPCRTVKKLLLAVLALLGSAIVAAVLVGSVLAMGLAVWRLRRGQRRRRRPRRQCPFQAELQAVVGALVPRELEKQGEPSLEYRSLEHSSV